MEPAALHGLASALPYYCIRCFVCDYRGNLLSQVYHLDGHDAVRTAEGLPGSGVFWHVFTQGLSVLHRDGRGYMSGIYKNVVTKENVMTYMHTLGQDRLLCVDIMPTVLC